MSHQPCVSIVMPIYNAGDYLVQALDSVVSQTLEDVEIVCVNDGSTDGSLATMQAYAERDRRIRVIDKPNGGYGNAMNTGIDAATGAYVGILEPDDYVVSDMYRTLYARALADDLDFVRSDFRRFTTDENGREVFQLEKICDKARYYGPTLNPQENLDLFNVHMQNWTGIYKTSFLRDNGIRFNESPGAGFQDNGFWFQTYCCATKVAFIEKPFYCYRNDNENSSINQTNKVFVMLDEYAWIYRWLKERPELYKRFVGVYHYKKIHNCEFAFSRLAEEFQMPFLERYAQEYRDAYAAGEIDIDLFYPEEWQRTKAIMDDPASYCEQYRAQAADACHTNTSSIWNRLRHHLRQEGVAATAKRIARRLEH